MKTFLIFLVILATNAVNSANILFLSPLASPSHFIYNKALAYELASKGHNLTFFSADVEEKPVKNVHFIHVETMYPLMNKFMAEYNVLEHEDENDYLSVFMMYEMIEAMCDSLLSSNGMSQLNAYPDTFKFDLVIHDFTITPCHLAVLPKFQYPPVIGITAFSNPPYTADTVGGDRLGLTVKPYYTLNYDKDMNIFQRLNNGFLNFLDALLYKFMGVRQANKAIKKYIGNDIPDLAVLIRKTSLALVNSNPLIDFAESLPPNVIEVGGLQLKEPQKLEKDIDEFLTKGKKGAVLMSLGTNIRSDLLGEERIEAFIKAFEAFPDYNFLWKFETPDQLSDKLPPNVKIMKWVRQNDILGHPNVKAFMSHSGLLSTHEATFHGVPIISIPFFADQLRNSFKSLKAGVGVKISIKTVTVEEIKNAIKEVLSNPSYAKNAQIRSKLFKDRPQKPLNLAVWWCEYLLRNPSPSHLQLSEFNFGIIGGANFWDIQAIIVIALIILIVGVKKLFKKLLKGKKVDASKKKN